MRVYMSGGTTGASRPTLYTAWDREAGAILMARALHMQGIQPGDVVINAWAYSTHNGAHAMDEALYRWLNCVVLTTGTGNVTPTRKQIELAVRVRRQGDPHHRRLSAPPRRDREVEMGLDPKTDLQLTALPNIGDKDRLTSTFGLPVYDSYGFHEVQWVAIECPAGDGLHIFEDAFVVQIVDVETGEPVPDGEQGAICITEIYKTGSPQFRYNIMDLSTLLPPGQCECGSWLRKMAPFAGRGDNMVKLRGVNIWPEALGDIVAEHRRRHRRLLRAGDPPRRQPRRDDDAWSRAKATGGRPSTRSPTGCGRAASTEVVGVKHRRSTVVAPGELDAPHRVRHRRQARPLPGRSMIDPTPRSRSMIDPTPGADR